MLSLADPDAAVAELDYVLAHGARIVHMRPAPVPDGHGRRATRSATTRHDPVWARLAEASVPVAFHLGDSGYNVAGRRGLGRARAVRAVPRASTCSTRLLVSDRAIHDTIGEPRSSHGVFTRHPTLRVASIENGSDWMHSLVKRLRKQANQTPWVFAEDPLDTIRRHVWVTPYYEEDMRTLADLIGVERILFGSDWPHGEGLAEPDRLREGARRLHRRRGPRRSCATTASSCSSARRPVDRASTRRRPPSRTPASTRRSAPGSTSTGTPTSRSRSGGGSSADAGWTAPHFTTEEGGRGCSRRSPVAVRAAFAELGALRPPGGLGLLMAAPTILTHGTPEQIDAATCPPILDGRGRRGASCSASRAPAPTSPASPPGRSATATTGSSTARRCGAAMAREADYGMLLARTDFDGAQARRASRGSRSRSTSPASRSGRCGR